MFCLRRALERLRLFVGGPHSLRQGSGRTNEVNQAGVSLDHVHSVFETFEPISRHRREQQNKGERKQDVRAIVSHDLDRSSAIASASALKRLMISAQSSNGAPGKKKFVSYDKEPSYIDSLSLLILTAKVNRNFFMNASLPDRSCKRNRRFVLAHAGGNA
jgi:hypothetical protein